MDVERLLALSADPGPRRRALRELVRVRVLLDEVEERLVLGLRREGASWSEIGADLGITRQGAHRRHARRDPIAVRGRR